MTPVRDPANIDRQGLVGVGELATPRWGKLFRRPSDDDNAALDILQEEDSAEVVVPNVEPDGPDSPWTIEAVDGEDELDQVFPLLSLLVRLPTFPALARPETLGTHDPSPAFSWRRERRGRDSLSSSTPRFRSLTPV